MENETYLKFKTKLFTYIQQQNKIHVLNFDKLSKISKDLSDEQQKIDISPKDFLELFVKEYEYEKIYLGKKLYGKAMLKIHNNIARLLHDGLVSETELKRFPIIKDNENNIYTNKIIGMTLKLFF